MKVTVALSTYNVAPYLEETLARIEGQALRDIEILCIDDASTDSTLEILKHHAAKDNRYRILSQPRNQGLAVSRNRALAEARGQYVCFVDGDDLMDFDLMETALAKAETSGADMVIWDYYEFGENLFNHVRKEAPSALEEINPTDRHSIVRLMAFTWTRLCRTDSLRSLGAYFPEGRTKQDQPIHWLTATCMPRVAVLAERKYGYRISSGQTSQKRGREMLDMAYVARDVRKVLSDNGKLDEFMADFIHWHLGFLYSMWSYISDDYKPEALRLICEDFTSKHSESLSGEHRMIRNFYKGLVEGRFLNKHIYVVEKILRKIYQILIDRCS